MSSKEVIFPEKWEAYRRYTFSPGVKKGKVIFLSGFSATDYEATERKFVGEGDIVAQTRQIYKNMKKVLETANASMADIVQTTDYITTTEGYKGTADVRREFFGDSFPASTGIIVAGLLNPKAQIEIDAVAVVDD